MAGGEDRRLDVSLAIVRARLLQRRDRERSAPPLPYETGLPGAFRVRARGPSFPLMRPDERLAVARLAYLQAIDRARAEPDAASWRRLLTAANNLRTAIRDRGGRRVTTGAAGLATGAAPARATAVLLAFPVRPPPDPARWSAIPREIERARKLVAEAQALRAEACAIIAESRALIARSRALRVAHRS